MNAIMKHNGKFETLWAKYLGEVHDYDILMKGYIKECCRTITTNAIEKQIKGK